MRKLLAPLLSVVMLAYPFAVAWAISHGHLFWVSLILLLFAAIRYFLLPNSMLLPLTLFAILCGSFSLLLNDPFWLKFYPVLMSLGSSLIFAFSLYRPPSLIERFARLHQPNLPESGVRWTRQVTWIWTLFLLFNAVLAFCTVFAPIQVWLIYNGCISYLLMGVLLLGEFVLRKKYQNRID